MLLLNMIKRRYHSTALRKIKNKIFRENNSLERMRSLEWIKTVEQPLNVFCRNIDAKLWEKAEKSALLIEKDGKKKLQTIGIDLGGGGC